MNLVSIIVTDGTEEFVNPDHIQAISSLPTPPGEKPRSRIVVSSGAVLQAAGTPREVVELITERMVNP